MITANQHTRAFERLTVPNMLEVAWSLVLRPTCRNAPRQIATVDAPRTREVVHTHRGHPLAFSRRSVPRHGGMNRRGGTLVPTMAKERTSDPVNLTPANQTECCVNDRAPHHPPPLAPVLDRNIRALWHRRAEEAQSASWQERAADAMTRFSGSMPFIYIHIAFFGLWIAANLGWLPGIPIWDSSFAVLAMVASVEAIFLSTFVLMTQNRMAAAADKRADLDLQISLLAEHEITRLAKMLAAISEKLNVPLEDEAEVEEIKTDVAPEAVLDRIEETSH